MRPRPASRPVRFDLRSEFAALAAEPHPFALWERVEQLGDRFERFYQAAPRPARPMPDPRPPQQPADSDSAGPVGDRPSPPTPGGRPPTEFSGSLLDSSARPGGVRFGGTLDLPTPDERKPGPRISADGVLSMPPEQAGGGQHEAPAEPTVPVRREELPTGAHRDEPTTGVQRDELLAPPPVPDSGLLAPSEPPGHAAPPGDDAQVAPEPEEPPRSADRVQLAPPPPPGDLAPPPPPADVAEPEAFGGTPPWMPGQPEAVRPPQQFQQPPREGGAAEEVPPPAAGQPPVASGPDVPDVEVTHQLPRVDAAQPPVPPGPPAESGPGGAPPGPPSAGRPSGPPVGGPVPPEQPVRSGQSEPAGAEGPVAGPVSPPGGVPVPPRAPEPPPSAQPSAQDAQQPPAQAPTWVGRSDGGFGPVGSGSTTTSSSRRRTRRAASWSAEEVKEGQAAVEFQSGKGYRHGEDTPVPQFLVEADEMLDDDEEAESRLAAPPVLGEPPGGYRDF